MNAETTLLSTPDATVTLAHGEDSSALVVVNGAGRVRVPLSDAQARRLESAAPGGGGVREIERKHLVRALPSGLETAPHQRLRQGYLVVEPKASLRIREKGGGWTITVKRGTGLERLETELDLSVAQANVLWPLAGDWIIDKTRYQLPDDGGTLELDVYHGRHEGLAVLEREFETASEAAAWSPPGWAGADITEDGRYTNARLAVDGPP
jgi:CYTH domain-containing protein